MSSSSDSSKIKIIVGSVVAIVAIIVGIFIVNGQLSIDEITQIASTTPSTTYDNPIPFIFAENFRRQLTSFVHNDSHCQTLLIVGPSGSGKSRGLRQFQSELNANNTLVFNFDFKQIGPDISSNDLMFSIHQDISASIHAVDTKSFPVQSVLPILEKYVSLLSTTLSRPPYKKFHNPLLSNVTQYYYTIFDHIRVSPSLAFRTLLEASEAISSYIHPVFMISEPENLLECTNEKIGNILTIFWEELRDFYMNDHSLPIITEVSDQSAITLHKLPFDHDQFKFLYNTGFSFKEAEAVLVKKEKIFTKQELQLLFDTFGAHGQSIAYAHELTREGYTIGESITQIRDNSRGQVISTLKRSSNETRFWHFMKKVQSNKVLPVNYDEESAVYSLRNKLTTLVNGTKVEIGNKILSNVISDILHQ
ncbi:hypothetical protein TRFO_22249 [Tritrichomonas foetus]|uniref:Uncharacterized protein n=1 Tax=Tritrichomonas foetus TaxID=1144522 RepID=A0A1J4KH80_9EUKA|nr:hypothetical protein TRFO_22249 [Tritrichomonas foetus]|eukprot:OHT09006.1 hypothetical protein TRFO_22249 [Tritrichomonas foetus]